MHNAITVQFILDWL